MDERAGLMEKVAMCRRLWASITDDASRQRLIEYTENLEIQLRGLAQITRLEDVNSYSDMQQNLQDRSGLLTVR